MTGWNGQASVWEWWCHILAWTNQRLTVKQPDSDCDCSWAVCLCCHGDTTVIQVQSNHTHSLLKILLCNVSRFAGSKITVSQHYTCQWWRKIIMIHNCMKPLFTFQHRVNYSVFVIWGMSHRGRDSLMTVIGLFAYVAMETLLSIKLGTFVKLLSL